MKNIHSDHGNFFDDIRTQIFCHSHPTNEADETLIDLHQPFRMFCANGELDPGLIDLAKALARMNSASDLKPKLNNWKRHANSDLRQIQQPPSKQPFN